MKIFKWTLCLVAVAFLVTAVGCEGKKFQGEPDLTEGGPAPEIKIPGIEMIDTDGDGVPDVEDNCPEIANADQKFLFDTDGDGVKDACVETEEGPEEVAEPEIIDIPSEERTIWGKVGEKLKDIIGKWRGIKQYGDEKRNEANGITVDKYQNIQVVGKTFVGEGRRPLWLTFSSIGEVEQNRLRDLEAFSSDVVDVVVDQDGNIYLAANIYNVEGSQVVVLEKYDSKGENKLWTRVLNSAGKDRAYALAVDNDRNVIYIAGLTYGDLNRDNSYDKDGDAFIVQYSFAGNRHWITEFGSPKYDVATGIAVDSGGHVYISGFTYDKLPEADPEADQIGGNDAFLAKFYDIGNFINAVHIGTIESDAAYGLSVDNENNVYVVGSTYGLFGEREFGNSDMFVAKYNSDLTEQIWKQQMGNMNKDEAGKVIADNEGNIFVLGNAFIGADRGHFVLYKYSAANCALIDSAIVEKEEEKENVGTAMALDKKGNIYVTGYTYGDLGGENAGESDIFVVKFNSDLELQ